MQLGVRKVQHLEAFVREVLVPCLNNDTGYKHEYVTTALQTAVTEPSKLPHSNIVYISRVCEYKFNPWRRLCPQFRVAFLPPHTICDQSVCMLNIVSFITNCQSPHSLLLILFIHLGHNMGRTACSMATVTEVCIHRFHGLPPIYHH